MEITYLIGKKTKLSSSIAPTVIIRGLILREAIVPGRGPSLPAATHTTIPLAHAFSAAKRTGLSFQDCDAVLPRDKFITEKAAAFAAIDKGSFKKASLVYCLSAALKALLF